MKHKWYYILVKIHCSYCWYFLAHNNQMKNGAKITTWVLNFRNHLQGNILKTCRLQGNFTESWMIPGSFPNIFRTFFRRLFTKGCCLCKINKCNRIYPEMADKTICPRRIKFGILELQNRVTKSSYAKWRHTLSN